MSFRSLRQHAFLGKLDELFVLRCDLDQCRPRLLIANVHSPRAHLFSPLTPVCRAIEHAHSGSPSKARRLFVGVGRKAYSCITRGIPVPAGPKKNSAALS